MSDDFDKDNEGRFEDDEMRTGEQDWRQARREARQARREARWGRREAGVPGGFGWAAGAILIILGVVFLLQNFGLFSLENWWALFLLIPAFGALSTAWALYRGSGNRLTYAVRGPLLGGVVLLGVAFAFLFGLDFSLIWPFVLILGGLALLIGALIPGHQ